MGEPITATWYDGRSARGRPVQATVEDGTLWPGSPSGGSM